MIVAFPKEHARRRLEKATCGFRRFPICRAVEQAKFSFLIKSPYITQR